MKTEAVRGKAFGPNFFSENPVGVRGGMGPLEDRDVLEGMERLIERIEVEGLNRFCDQISPSPLCRS